MRRVLSCLFLCSLFLLFSAYASAQDDTPADTEGCTDSTLVTRYPRSHIDSCDNKEFDAADFPVQQKPDGSVVTKHLEGEYRESIYITQTGVSALQLTRNFQGALKNAGFTIDYSSPPEEVVGHKGNTWVYVLSRTESYEQKIVTVKEMVQEVKADAAGLENEIEKTGQVAVYGIHFDTGKASLKPDSDTVLSEIVKMMQQNPGLKLKIEGHTDNLGTAASNQVLSQKRSESVVAWLAAHGVDASRLTATGRGQTVPIGDNSTDDGRAKNRRVELVKN